MFNLNFLPPALRELLDYLSPLALEVIPWMTLVQTGPLLLRRFVTKDGVANLKLQLAPLLPADVAFSDADLDEESKLSALSDAERKEVGDRVLRLYFAQLKCADGLFIDIRPNRFALQKDGRLAFSPTGLWTALQPSARRGLIKVYLGFYREDQELYEEALVDLGMIKPQMSKEARARLKTLLAEQFSPGSQPEMRFSIERFRESFHALFKFFIEERIKLDGDFLFIGLYLVTLYLHLDQLGQRHDVQAIVEESFTDEALV